MFLLLVHFFFLRTTQANFRKKFSVNIGVICMTSITQPLNFSFSDVALNWSWVENEWVVQRTPFTLYIEDMLMPRKMTVTSSWLV